MLWKLLALFILMPLAELWLLLMLARNTSVATTLLLVVVTGLAGTLLAKSQGLLAFRRISTELAQGRLPTDALLDAAMIFFAGALLLTPGLLTDLLGISLLIPFCRRRYRAAAVQWIRARFRIEPVREIYPEGRSQIVDSYVVEKPDDGHPHGSGR